MLRKRTLKGRNGSRLIDEESSALLFLDDHLLIFLPELGSLESVMSSAAVGTDDLRVFPEVALLCRIEEVTSIYLLLVLSFHSFCLSSVATFGGSPGHMQVHSRA